MLLGTYTSTGSPGEFVWLPGVLTKVCVYMFKLTDGCDNMYNIDEGCGSRIPDLF